MLENETPQKPRKLRFLDDWDAVAYLKDHCKIKGFHITVKKNSFGLKRWGAVDYLVNHHQYLVIMN